VSLGKGWFFVPAKDTWTSEAALFSTVSDVLRAVERDLLDQGGKAMEVKVGYDRRYYVGADKTPLSVERAVAKVATEYDVPVASAVKAVARAGTPSKLWALPAAKTAADDKAPPPGGEDPNAAPMDPNAMAAMQGPPPPSGLDLAIAEQMQQIQMQIQALNDKSMALQTVQQRAMQIDGGGGAMAAPMGAAAMAGGAPPPVGGMPPQDPNAQAGAAPQGAPGMGQPGMPPGQPGMPQGQPGMGQPGMPPGQPGMGAPGMPGQQPQAPQPVMTNASLSSNDIASSINPAFLEQASLLDNAQVFDAAALGSLAKQKNLRGSMLSYATNLEKSLDNLGRILLLLNLQEGELKNSVGNDAYTATEQAVRDTFKGLGEVILGINQTSDQLAATKSLTY
jgi:hypothetical protein